MLEKHIGELNEYGQDIIDKDQFLLNFITKFSTSYCNNIDGTAMWNVESQELRGGARICHIFHKVFAGEVDAINISNTLNKSEIQLAIRNCSGPRPPLFIPEISFELLNKKLIKKLEAPAIKCVQLVFKELESVITQFDENLKNIFDRFPNIQSKVFEVTKDTLRSYLANANEFIRKLINHELAYINTKHPDFRKELEIVSKYMRNGKKSPKSDRDTTVSQ